MPEPARCPSCSSRFRIPDGSEGKRLRCPGCKSVLQVDGDAPDGVRLMESKTPASCPQCNAALADDATFCAECGARVSEDVDEAVVQREKRRVRRHAAEREKHVSRAGIWILIIAVVIAGFGTFAGFQARSAARDARQQLAGTPQDEIIEFEGQSRTVAEWLDAADSEALLVFLSNYLVAAVMLGLFFWSRRSPFPAIATALCVYLAVQVLNAIMDPTTIYKGLLIKILLIGALVAALRAVLRERDARERAVRRAGEGALPATRAAPGSARRRRRAR